MKVQMQMVIVAFLISRLDSFCRAKYRALMFVRRCGDVEVCGALRLFRALSARVCGVFKIGT
jgi:hypothetical protein